jgi:Zn-dependent peptidase ImmA (M78 family)/transcriptional regulator with XRE-family HTH domain
MIVQNGGAKRPLLKPIPERIKEAREARGLTLDSFAEAIGVTRQAVAQYETGQIAPGGEALSRIIAVTAQPPSFFITARDRAQSGMPFWRSLKRMELHHRRRVTRRLEWARDIATYLDSFIHLPTVRLPSISFDVTSDDDTQIELAAEALRDFWGLGRTRIRDLAYVLENNGIVLVYEQVHCRDMDAVSCWQAARPYLLFSSEVESGPRCTFNLAHELGHLLLHAGVEVTTKNLSRIERQANRFAGAFLLPRTTFSQEVLGTSLNYFKSLKSRWGIAIAAMAYRCKDLGIFDANQYAYILKQMNMLRIRNPEPLDEVFPVEKPTMLADSLKMLIEKGVRTREQLEADLNLNLGDVESLCGVRSGFLEMRIVPFQPRPR